MPLALTHEGWCAVKHIDKSNLILFICMYVSLYYIFFLFLGGARGVMVIVTGYGHGDTISIPGQDWLHFT